MKKIIIINKERFELTETIYIERKDENTKKEYYGKQLNKKNAKEQLLYTVEHGEY